jgi:hypothetical protein
MKNSNDIIGNRSRDHCATASPHEKIVKNVTCGVFVGADRVSYAILNALNDQYENDRKLGLTAHSSNAEEYSAGST